MTDPAQPLLEVDDVHTYYGNIHALRGVSLAVFPGEIVTLIGGNGAGKSTTLNTISGIVRPRSGAVRLGGEDLAACPAHEVVARGVTQVPEGRRMFARLTVLENLQMGAYVVSDKATIAHRIEEVFELFPRLRERQRQVAGTLSGGEQQMLAMGRALMSGPKVLLLDEPSMGLAPVLVDQIFATIARLNEAGTTILLVEQNARMALQVANRGYVIETGRIVLDDQAEALRDNEMVQKAYLGIA
jgi:branched-chain amino acid transport system ATP-binding protein